MIKKFFSIILVLFVINMFCIPALAKNDTNDNVKFIEIDTNLVSELNVNKSNKGQIIQFISTQDYKNSQGIIIPKGTLFNGKIASMKKSRFAYRRAKAKIELLEMVFPNGNKYKITGHTARKVYKGSAIGNTVKGITTAPIALVVGVVGGTVIVAEAVTIVGLLLVGPTGALVGGTMGKLTNGVNCKIDQGTSIPVKIHYKKHNEYSVMKDTAPNTYSEKQVQGKVDINNVDNSEQVIPSEQSVLNSSSDRSLQNVIIKDTNESEE